MKKHLSTIFLFLIFFIGLSLLLYPTFSDWWNTFHQSQVVAGYIEQVANMDDDQYEKIWPPPGTITVPSWIVPTTSCCPRSSGSATKLC